jgi:acetyl esterase/lipase
MPENIEFATHAQAAGAPVSARIYAGMFHDFEEFSQGCGERALRPFYPPPALACVSAWPLSPLRHLWSCLWSWGGLHAAPRGREMADTESGDKLRRGAG